MKERARKYLEAGAPPEIRHGEYVGRLVDVQPLNDGYVTGIYRFPGGECCPAEAPIIKMSYAK
jgi:hypothetical protein